MLAAALRRVMSPRIYRIAALRTTNAQGAARRAPSPRAGRYEQSRSRGAFSRPSFANLKDQAPKQIVASGRSCFVYDTPLIDSLPAIKEAERRQTHCLMPARKRRAGRATEKGGLRRPPLAGALACRRSTAVLAKGTFVPRAQHRARLPEDGAKAAAGRTRHFRSQRCTSRAGQNAGRHDAGAARARSVPFRPRAAHSLRRQGVPQRRPLRARLGALIVFAAGKSNGLKPPNKRGSSPDASFLKVRSTRMILWRCGEVVRIAALFAPTTNLAAAEAS
jgi:hypothetical protein